MAQNYRSWKLNFCLFLNLNPNFVNYLFPLPMSHFSLTITEL